MKNSLMLENIKHTKHVIRFVFFSSIFLRSGDGSSKFYSRKKVAIILMFCLSCEKFELAGHYPGVLCGQLINKIEVYVLKWVIVRRTYSKV